jgi:hypothetical protein
VGALEENGRWAGPLQAEASALLSWAGPISSSNYFPNIPLPFQSSNFQKYQTQSFYV